MTATNAELAELVALDDVVLLHVEGREAQHVLLRQRPLVAVAELHDDGDELLRLQHARPVHVQRVELLPALIPKAGDESTDLTSAGSCSMYCGTMALSSRMCLIIRSTRSRSMRSSSSMDMGWKPRPHFLVVLLLLVVVVVESYFWLLGRPRSRTGR